MARTYTQREYNTALALISFTVLGNLALFMGGFGVAAYLIFNILSATIGASIWCGWCGAPKAREQGTTASFEDIIPKMNDEALAKLAEQIKEELVIYERIIQRETPAIQAAEAALRINQLAVCLIETVAAWKSANTYCPASLCKILTLYRMPAVQGRNLDFYIQDYSKNRDSDGPFSQETQAKINKELYDFLSSELPRSIKETLYKNEDAHTVISLDDIDRAIVFITSSSLNNQYGTERQNQEIQKHLSSLRQTITSAQENIRDLKKRLIPVIVYRDERLEKIRIIEQIQNTKQHRPYPAQTYATPEIQGHGSGPRPANTTPHPTPAAIAHDHAPENASP